MEGICGYFMEVYVSYWNYGVSVLDYSKNYYGCSGY